MKFGNEVFDAERRAILLCRCQMKRLRIGEFKKDIEDSAP